MVFPDAHAHLPRTAGSGQLRGGIVKHQHPIAFPRRREFVRSACQEYSRGCGFAISRIEPPRFDLAARHLAHVHFDRPATLNNIKDNSALIQDLLNKLSGKAGKAWFCDDVYQIAALASKLNTTKAALAGDMALLREFLTQLEDDLAHIDDVVFQRQVLRLSKAVCDASDGRHWDNSWAAATGKRMARCSKEHCYGPKHQPVGGDRGLVSRREVRERERSPTCWQSASRFSLGRV
jgi:hypothetical protein